MNINIIKTLILLFIASGVAYGQTELPIVDYTSTQEYEIGGIKVQGLQYRDDNAIIAVSGLRVGQTIQVPGQEIPVAIEQLLKLQLFTDIEVIKEKTIGNVIFLIINIKERPVLSRYSYQGVKKTKHEDLNEIVDNVLTKGGIVTEDKKQLVKNKLFEYYLDKGYMDAEIKVNEYSDSLKENSVRLEFEIDKKKRVRITEISFEGNEETSDRKLRAQFENTKLMWNPLKKSKFIKRDYENDKEGIVAFYNNIGHRDAEILSDSIWRDDKGRMHINIEVEEGNKYYFRDIEWKGNSIYTDDYLSKILGIERGDIYNKELLDKRLSFSLDGRDISSLYMDDGYLMFRVDPVERSITGDSIDIEVRINEGPQVTIDKVVIKGNDRTHENVIRRELRTRPGAKFSRSDIIRSQRQILNLGYFNQETLGINPKVNAERGTVDIEYTLEERPSDQLELSAGYGGFNGLIGTLGLTFNNFSLTNINNREAWNPLPVGDGQKLSVRAQSNSRFFKSYNGSFTEPWLGGKRPTSFTLGGAYSEWDQSLYGVGKLAISRAFVGIGTQLKWPDDYFSYFVTANIENIALDDYAYGGFGINNGEFNNYSIKQTLTRSSINEPIFPRRGSKISLTLQLTPYYWGRKGNYYEIDDAEAEELIYEENLKRGLADKLSPSDEVTFIREAEDATKFRYLEYHKWRLDAEWYYNLVDKLVLMTQAKVGFLGSYRPGVGVSPFERFELGGDGLNNQNVGIQGRDIISSRGYEVNEFPANDSQYGGATIFNKYTVELRYPISTNPNSTIYVSAFAQGANSFVNFRDYNPFELKRSAGLGLRVFLPMFGLMGFDYGFGFDKNLPDDTRFTEYATFNIILGFDPD